MDVVPCAWVQARPGSLYEGSPIVPWSQLPVGFHTELSHIGEVWPVIHWIQRQLIVGIKTVPIQNKYAKHPAGDLSMAGSMIPWWFRMVYAAMLLTWKWGEFAGIMSYLGFIRGYCLQFLEHSMKVLSVFVFTIFLSPRWFSGITSLSGWDLVSGFDISGGFPILLDISWPMNLWIPVAYFI